MLHVEKEHSSMVSMSCTPQTKTVLLGKILPFHRQIVWPSSINLILWFQLGIDFSHSFINTRCGEVIEWSVNYVSNTQPFQVQVVSTLNMYSRSHEILKKSTTLSRILTFQGLCFSYFSIMTQSNTNRSASKYANMIMSSI